MHRIPARLMAFTGRDTSTTGFFSEWALGPAGAMATAGVAIGSATAVVGAIAAAAARQQLAGMLLAGVAVAVLPAVVAEKRAQVAAPMR